MVIRVQNGSNRVKRIAPGLTLFLLAPILAELVSGHQTPLEFFNPLSLVVLSLPYGCGALICRELVVRQRKGWLSLLLLAIAFGVYVEGIVVRSIFNPNWAELGALALYNHVAGVNWTYALLLIHFHLLISIGASVTLAEILYPQRRHQRWISNRALIGCSVCIALWIPQGLVMTSYRPLEGLYVLSWLAVLTLIRAAHRVPAQPLPPIERAVPRPRRFFLAGLLNMSAFFLIVFLTPEYHWPPLLVTVLMLLALDGVTLWLILHWSGNGSAWDDRHRLALVAGLLTFFICFGILQDLEEWRGASIVGVITVVALWRLGHRVGSRSEVGAQAISQPLPLEGV